MNMHYRLVIAHVQSFPCVEWTNVFTCTSLSLLSRAQLHPLSTAPKTSCMDAFRMSELALESTEGLLIRPTQTDHQDQSNTHSSKITKFLVGTLLFSIVITCTVLSKLSLISLVSQFNKTIDGINSVNNSEAIQLSLHDRAAGIFWQLLFIILIPQFVTFFRALLFGVCGKQSRTFPWPTLKATPTVSGQLPIISPCMRTAGVHDGPEEALHGVRYACARTACGHLLLVASACTHVYP